MSMMMNLRRRYGGKVLPYDAEVEYIESTGTQWVAVGLLGKNGYDFDYKVNFTQLSTSQATGIGGEYQSNKSCYLGMVRTDGTLAYHYKGTASPVVVASNIQTGTDYVVNAHLYSGEQYYIVNGTKSSVGNITGNFVSSLYLRLFSVNSSSPLYSYMRLYYCKIYDNGILVRDYIPVRLGTTGYLYDKVSHTLFGNAGTGSFIIGPDKVLPYDAEVKYLESTGTQWIDTGVVGIQPTDEFSIEVAMLSTRMAMVYGWSTSNRWYDLNLYHSSAHKTELAWGGPNVSIRVEPPNIGDFHLYQTSVLSNKLHFFIDGIDVGNLAVQTENNTMHGYLFGRNVSGSISNLSSLIIKKFSYKRSGEYILDLIPVRVGQVGFMYDKVSKRLFGNSGTDAFIVGPDVV